MSGAASAVARRVAGPAIQLNEVEKRFGAIRALRDVSFRIPAGSLCGIVGPNGAGKTTTLRIIATDLAADAGEVEVLGERLPGAERRVRPRLGYMPDTAGLYEELTLAEYLGFFAAFAGLKGAARERAVATTLELTGSEHFAGRRLVGLSKGERQRVGLARALIHDPELLVLDEPADGLDPRGRVELRELLGLLHERGKTIVISSHILADLEEICTELLLVDRGRVRFAGSRERLLSSGLERCRIRIEALGEEGQLARLLGATPEIVVEDAVPGKALVDAPADPAFAAELLARLHREGLRVYSFARNTESLEALYLRLTEAERQEPDARGAGEPLP